MQLKAILLTITLGFFCFRCWAENPPQAPIPPLESKKIWLANMQKNLPSLLCQKEHFFVSCFDTNEAQCLEITQMLVQTCLNNVTQSIPNALTSSQVEYWGQIVGRCSYDVYQKMQQDKKRNTPACNEAAKP